MGVHIWYLIQKLSSSSATLHTDGLSLLNEDGGLRVFFPRNSFVTNTSLTHTDNPRILKGSRVHGNDHIACNGGDLQATQVTWHNNSGGQLLVCHGLLLPARIVGPALCLACGFYCSANGGVGQDRPLNGSTDIHMYTDSPAYVNQDLECRASDDQSAFIGVYLENGGEVKPSLTD